MLTLCCLQKAVFDSSPCLEESAAIPALAVREAVPGPFWFKQFLYLMIFSVFTVWIALGRATGRSFSPRVYFGVPLILKSNAQKLFLFSSTDPFTDSKLLKEFIAKVGGYSFDFGDSKHVQHYRTYPELYRQEMQKFLKV
jgi:hypothetical protein